MPPVGTAPIQGSLLSSTERGASSNQGAKCVTKRCPLGRRPLMITVPVRKLNLPSRKQSICHKTVSNSRVHCSASSAEQVDLEPGPSSPLSSPRMPPRSATSNRAACLAVVASVRRGNPILDGRRQTRTASNQQSGPLSRHQSGVLSRNRRRPLRRRSLSLSQASPTAIRPVQEANLLQEQVKAPVKSSSKWSVPLRISEENVLSNKGTTGGVEFLGELEGLAADVTSLSILDLVSREDVFTPELSWLCFNWRVLHIASDQSTPLYEKLRFLTLAAANLDEFYECRVGGLKLQAAAMDMDDGYARRKGDSGRSPQQQLKLVSRAVRKMLAAQTEVLRNSLIPDLRKHGVFLHSSAELTASQKQSLRGWFRKSVEPLLTPLGVDPGHPFPHVRHQSLNIAVQLRDPLDDDELFAIVTVPSNLPRWRRLQPEDEAGRKDAFVLIEQVIMDNLDCLFGGMEVLGAHPFRATRTMRVLDDMRRLDEEHPEDQDLLEIVAHEMHERRFSPFVRLAVDEAMPAAMLKRLVNEMGLDSEQDVYRVHGPLALAELQGLVSELGPDPPLRFRPWLPVTPPQLQKAHHSRPESIFEAIRTGDILVCHPYHSFATSTQAFVEAAAKDPQVAAIKIVLYRTNPESPLVQALLGAAENGKEVSVLVELKARCDESRNIMLAQRLEDAGCNVAYGFIGITTHCKAALVVRREGKALKSYVHLGTGDYNPRQAATYADFGLLSCNKELAQVFLRLKGYSEQILPYWEQILPYWEQILSYWEQILPYWEQILSYWEQILSYWEQILPYWEQILPYWEQILPYWEQILPPEQTLRSSACCPLQDVTDLFKYLTGYHQQGSFQKLLLAPHNMRGAFLDMCDVEIANAQKGLPARITVKCNALDDKAIARKMYEAGAAGVKVDLIVRGMCRVRAGVPGVSENIRVVSILGRFLEHGRIYRFENGGQPKFFMASSDWVSRDLLRRVEVAAPVEDPRCQKDLQDILDSCFTDGQTAWEMQPDGSYRLRQSQGDKDVSDPVDGQVASRAARAASMGLQEAQMSYVTEEAKLAAKLQKLKQKGQVRVHEAVAEHA